jgi:hypothetical protein
MLFPRNLVFRPSVAVMEDTSEVGDEAVVGIVVWADGCAVFWVGPSDLP